MGVTFSQKDGLKSNTSFNAGINAEFQKHNIGLSYGFIHYDDGLETNGALHDNPMAFWSVLDCKNTVSSSVVGYKYNDTGAVDTGLFIGIDVDLHFFLGGHLKIGFNLIEDVY